MRTLETRILMPELDSIEGHAVLVLTTMKPLSGGISSSAHIEFDGGGMMTYQPFSDFTTRIEHDRKSRCTLTNMQAQHARVFSPDNVELLKGRAQFHYASRKKEFAL